MEKLRAETVVSESYEVFRGSLVATIVHACTWVADLYRAVPERRNVVRFAAGVRRVVLGYEATRGES